MPAAEYKCVLKGMDDLGEYYIKELFEEIKKEKGIRKGDKVEGVEINEIRGIKEISFLDVYTVDFDGYAPVPPLPGMGSMLGIARPYKFEMRMEDVGKGRWEVSVKVYGERREEAEELLESFVGGYVKRYFRDYLEE